MALGARASKIVRIASDHIPLEGQGFCLWQCRSHLSPRGRGRPRVSAGG
jgi:hypothetical protein